MKLSTQILLAFAIVLLLSILDTFSNYLLSLKVEKNTEFIIKSQEVMRNSSNLQKEIIDMQSSFRGFLLTEDTNFLENYEVGLEQIPILFEDELNLISDNAKQSALLDSIRLMHLQWIGYANALIVAKQKVAQTTGLSDEYTQLFESKLKRQIGKRINEQIEKKFAEFDRIEYQTRSMRSSALLSSIRRTHILSLAFFSLTIIIGITVTIYIVSLISRRIKTMVTLAERISGGEFTTMEDKKNDELTRLSTSLNIMSVNLSRTIQELEKRNTELDKFAHVVSHDLKAPLRGIYNVMNWIDEDLGKELSPQLKKYQDIILQRTKRMEDLINGLLDYARIREKTVTEKTDVNELVSEIVESIVPRDFKVKINDLPTIVTERLKLEQVFANLISNAVKYTQNDSPEIIVSSQVLQDHYEFSVKDNGIGIESEYHDRIFEMFQTLREKDEKESTGIGLAITKKILDEQNCFIRIISELGKGSEFIFTWPRINNNLHQ